MENDLNVQLRTFKTLIDVKKGRYNSGSWIHPDLAVQLAQWISPAFAIQVSRWIRELFTTGNVSIESKKSDEELIALQNQVRQLQMENKEKDVLLEEKDAILEEKDETLNRLHNIQKELLSYKKRVTKEETIYIVSTANYARQGIFKIGRTKTKMRLRSSSHNNTHIAGDKVKVLREFKVNDSTLVERNIHTKLNGLLIEGEKEFFLCPFNLLESTVDLIIHNDDQENEMVSKIIDTVYRLKQVQFNSTDWTEGIPENAFEEKLLITQGDEKLAELDVTRWNEAAKQQFVAHCIKEYVKQENNMNEDEFQIIWKTFQTFLFNQLNIPKNKFKSTDWKQTVKDEVKKEKLSIKWRV